MSSAPPSQAEATDTLKKVSVRHGTEENESLPRDDSCAAGDAGRDSTAKRNRSVQLSAGARTVSLLRCGICYCGAGAKKV